MQPLSPSDTLLPDLTEEQRRQLALALADALLAEQQPPTITIDDVSLLDLDALASSVAGITDPIGQLKDWLYDVLKKFIDTIINAVTAAWAAFYDRVIKPALTAISSTLSGIANALGSSLSYIGNVLSEILSTLRSVVVEPIKDVVKWIQENIPRLTETISNLLGEAADALNRIRDAIAGIAGRVEDIVSRIADALRDAVSRAAQAAASVVDAVAERLRSLVEGIASVAARASEALRDIASRIGDIVDTVAGRLRDTVSRILETVGELADRIRGALAEAASAASRIVTSITSAVEGLADRLRGILSTVADAARQLVSRIADAAEAVATRLRSAVEAAASRIEDILGALRDAVCGILDRIRDVAEDALRGLAERIDSLASSIADAARRALEAVTGVASRAVAVIEDTLGRIAQQVRGIVDRIVDAARTAIERIADAAAAAARSLSGVVEAVVDRVKQLPGVVSRAADAIRAALESLAGAAGELRDKIEAIAEAVYQLFYPIRLAGPTSNLLKQVAPDLYEALVEIIHNIRNPLDAVRAFPHILQLLIIGSAQLVWYLMPDSVKGFFEKVANAVRLVGEELMGFVNAIMKFPEWFPRWFREHISGPIASAIDSIKSALSSLAGAVGGLAAAFSDLPGMIKLGVTSIAEFLWDKLVGAKDWLYNHVFQPALDAARAVWGATVDAAAALGDRLISTAVTVGNAIVGAAHRAASMVADAALRLAEFGIEIGKTMLRALTAVAGKIVPLAKHMPSYKIMKDVLEAEPAKAFADMTSIMLLPLALETRLMSSIVENARSMMPLVMQDPVSLLYGIANLAIMGSVIGLLFSSGYRAASSLFKGVRIRLSALLRPLGIGTESGTDIEVNLGDAMKELSEFIDRVMPDVARYIIIGHMIWWAEPTRAITRYWLTNYLTIELPPMEQTLRSLRRHLVTPLAPTYYTIYIEQLRMGGISQRFIDYLYPLTGKLVDQYMSLKPTYSDELKAIIITDRFGQPRIFPVSLVAEIPSPSELARMMIRDIILDPRDFAAVMGMHGYTPDTAFMFYLLHFRYPAPERLADFFWRGIAGELWNPDESYDENIVRLFFKQGQPPKPIAPKKLNFAAEYLFEIIKQYMKWHDYARIPWRPGWPTDNAIIMDLIADIPGKIDIRWMTRWGLFDYWGAYGATATTTIEEITRGLLAEGVVTSAEPMTTLYESLLGERTVVFDVRQFARALQATGLHPYWVPWVTIAETINALSEERTLLRTGFINLFREGLWPLDTLNRLLAGFFTVVFKTAYFDPDEMRWKEVDVEYPVAFLPAESKLLELRAVMDKALDIYREAYRRIIRAIAYNTVSVQQGKAILADIIMNINEKFFVKEISRISGKALQLMIDEGYWEAWETYAKVLQDIEAVERTRFYARYILWNVLWALRYGYTTVEEAEEWVDNLVRTMNEHPRIKAMIEQAVRFMIYRFQREIAVRSIINKVRSRRISIQEAIEQLVKQGFDEDTAKLYIEANVYWYTPSIPTYASMLEVVPEALTTVLDIVEQFSLPLDEKPYWILYLLRQPVRDELNLVRTRIYQLLALGVPAKEILGLLSSYMVGYTVREGRIVEELGQAASIIAGEYDENADTLRAYGITRHEWILYHLLAQLEMKKAIVRGEMKERIPSPSTLATLAEYLVLPEDLVRKTLEEYHVAPEWLPYWLEYIRVKPLKSDFKQLLTVYIRALRYRIVDSGTVESFIERLRGWGFTPMEIDLLRERVLLEETIAEMREASRLYIPTPSMLATLSEYMVLPEDLIQEALEKRRVPEEWRKIWLEYIRVRPMKSDYRQLFTTYVRALRYGAATRSDLEKLIRELASWGFTPRELEILERRVELEEAILAAREYLPTPYTLATLSEYLVLPEKLVKEVLERRRVPEEWIPVWLEYIRVRPLKSDYRRLLQVYIRAMRYGVVSRDEVERLIEELEKWGFTPREIDILKSIVSLEDAIADAREYIPTPSQLATIAEYVPAARKLAVQVLQRRRVPEEWWSIWLQYIHLRPLSSEVREVIRDIRSLYEYFAVKLEDMKKSLQQFIKYGLEDEEIALLVYGSQLRAALRAYRELVGTPRQLITIAEYSPRARRLALAQVYKMIDALPVDQPTKEFIKKMWEEYIRIRPVYDEVRRYVTELISDYAEGIMTDEELVNELNALKDWGLDDYEIQFYIWLAQRRRVRYAYRQMMEQGYFGL